jgi:WD40 repeat protein
MGIRLDVARLARKGFWLFLLLFILIIIGCSGITPVPSTPTPTLSPTARPEKASYQLSLEKSIGQGIAQAADWSPDGQTFAMGTSLQVDLYDSKTLKVIDSFDTGQPNQGVKFSPDSRLLAIALKDGAVQIWDLSQKRKAHSFIGGGLQWGYGSGQILCFSSDSQKLAIADYQTIYILDVTSGNLLDTFPGHGNSIVTAAFNQPGNILLAATSRQIFVRDLTSRELIYPSIELKEDLQSVFFDATDNRFITISVLDTYREGGGGFDYTSHLRFWDLATGALKDEYEMSRSDIYDVAVNLTQGKIILGGDKRIEIWDMSARKIVKTILADYDRVDTLALSPDGSQLISIIGRWTGVAQLWDLSTYKAVKNFDQYSIGANVQFSPDGRLVAEAGRNRLIQVRDTQSGKLLYSVEGNQPMSFSPDGKILAFAIGSPSQIPMSKYSDNLSLKMVDAETGQSLSDGFFNCTTLSAIAFSPDGKTVVYGGEYRDYCKLQIREVKSGETVLDLNSIEGNENLRFETLAFSPDGNKLVLGGYRSAILEVKTGKKLREFGNYSDAKVALSPDSRYLALSGGNSVKISDLATSQILFTLETTQNTINRLAFSPDGQLLAIAGEGLELWDAWTGQPLSKEEHLSSRINGLVFDQDGNGLLIVKEDSAIQHWKIDRESKTTRLARPTPTLIPTPTPTRVIVEVEIPKVAELGKGISSRVYYSPDGKIAAFMDGDNLAWFDVSTFEQLGKLEMGNAIGQTTGQLVFSPNGRIVVADTYMGAQIVDLQTKEILGGVSGGMGSAFGYTFTNDSQYLAYGIADRTTGGPYESIGLWSVATRQGVGDHYGEEGFFPTLLEGRYHVMSPPAISPNGKLVAAGHNDKRVYVWDLQTGKTRYILDGHAAIVNAVAFSPDGRLLASGSSDGTVRLWSPATGKPVRVLTGFPNDIFDVSFSADGKSLTVGIAEQPDQVVDLQSGQITEAPTPVSTPDPFEVRQSQRGYSTQGGTIFSSVTFSPDGKTLALASQNVLLWDVSTQKLLKFLENPQGGNIRGLVFSPDGKKLAVTTDCDEILAWDLETDSRVFLQKSDFLSGGTVMYGIGDTELGPARGSSAIAEQGLAFSPDSRSLVFGNDNLIEIWQLAEAKKVTTLVNPEGQYATQLSFSADGKHLYAVLNRNRGAQVWDISSGSLIKQVTLPEVDPNVYSAVTLNGPFFARNNAGTDGSSWIELWNLKSGETLELNMPSAENEPLRFSPDGSLLLAQNDGKIYFWKTDSGQLVYQTSLEGVGMTGLALSPDNLRLATEGEGKALLWDVSKIMQLSPSSAVPDFNPHPTATPVVIAWPTVTPQPTATASPKSGSSAITAIMPSNASKLEEQARFGQGAVEQVAWDPSGNSILVAGSLGISKYAFEPKTSTLTATSQVKNDGWNYDAIALPDGRLLSAGEANGHIYVWDSAGKVLADLEGNGRAALSPDGNYLAYPNPDHKLQIWDIQSNTSVITFPSYSFNFYSPVFSSDGNLVAAIKTGYGRYDDSARVWNIRTGAIVNALGGPDNDITDLSFSQDGRFITGAAGGSAWIWDLRPGLPPDQIQLYKVEINDNLNIYTQTVTAVALSPNNELVALGTSENQLQLYQRKTHQKLRDFKGLSSPVRQLRFSPDGRTLLSTDQDGTLALWEVASGKLLTRLDGHLGELGGLLFRQDGLLSIWGTGTNWVLRPRDGSLVQATRISSGKILAASPAGDWLAVYNPFQVSIWDARTGQFKKTLEGEAETPFVEYYWEGQAFRQFYAAAFSADGTRLVTAGAGGIWYYDTSNKRLLQQFWGSNAQKIALSPNGKQMLTSLYDQSQPITAYDLETGDEIFSFDWRGSNIFQAVFSPDGQWAGAVQASGNVPYELVLRNLSDDQLTKSLELGKEVPGISLAINPTSTLVAVGLADGKILLVDLEEMRVLATLSGHRGAIEHLAFSPDGIYLVSGGADSTVRTWGVR